MQVHFKRINKTSSHDDADTYLCRAYPLCILFLQANSELSKENLPRNRVHQTVGKACIVTATVCFENKINGCYLYYNNASQVNLKM